MAVRGQRFELDLSDDEGQFTARPIDDSQPPLTTDIIGEIRERDPASAAPAPPKFKPTSSGFPMHRKRPQTSRYKQQQENGAFSTGPTDTASLAQAAANRGPSDHAIAHHIGKKHGITSQDVEKRQIDQDNKAKLASMSLKEIEDARAELMAAMKPTLLEKLLKRSAVDDQTDPENSFDLPDGPKDHDNTVNLDQTSETSASRSAKKSAAYDLPSTQPASQEAPSSASAAAPNPPSSIVSDDTGPIAVYTPTIHFPNPPRNPSDMPNLDPSSPSFLTDLQTHYFPSTPHDPFALSWLQDPTPSEINFSPYKPFNPSTNPDIEEPSIPISSLRFSFTGTLLPPSISSTIPITEGLHSHGLDPDSAGYTIPELSILSRSTVPGQRCIAFMVLGRILYRLGSNQFGALGTEMVDGLWECVEHERGLEVMISEANRDGGHRSVKAYATEGVWLWRRGMEVGGLKGERGLVREGQMRIR